jgi:AcrR family transcriptional regulator
MDNISRTDELTPLARIVQSARECFLRQGVRKTRMADIAAGAGMVRQTVYDFVSSRDEVVDLAMRARIVEIADTVRHAPINPRATVSDQLVGTLAALVEGARSDVEMGLLVDTLPAGHAFRFIAGPSMLTDVLMQVLNPLLGRAQAEERLRTDVDTREMVEWIQTALAPLLSREDLTPPDLRRFLRLFVVPTLFRPDALTRPNGA